MTISAAEKRRLLARFNANPPATESAIRAFEKRAGAALSADYRGFLLELNGGEGFIGDAYLILWPVEQLQRLNEAYQVSIYAPGLLLIGSDGGGEAFAIDMRSAEKPIASVPFVGMDVAEARPIASSVKQFLEALEAS